MSQMNLKNKWIKKDMQVTELTDMIYQLVLTLRKPPVYSTNNKKQNDLKGSRFKRMEKSISCK